MGIMRVKKVSAGVLLNSKSEVLLQLRDAKSSIRSPGMWSFPGGCKKFYETPLSAVKREVREETNIVLEKPKYFLSIHDSFEEGSIVTVDFFVERLREPFEIILGEGQELKFFSPKELKNLYCNIYLAMVVDYAEIFLNKSSRE